MFRRSILMLYFLLPLAIWVGSVWPLSHYLSTNIPAGQIAYVFSKLAGIVGFFVLSYQLFFALINRRERLSIISPWSFRTHMLVGVLTVSVVLLHVGLFILASSQRTGANTFSLLLPRFTNGFYDFNVSLGVMAFWLLLVLIFAGARRRVIGTGKWVAVHRISFAIFALATAHSLFIGSETRTNMGLIAYGLIGIGVVYVFIQWLKSK